MFTLIRLLSASVLVAAAVQPAFAAKFTFHLPTSDNLPRQELDGGMIHGLCIMDATNFRATVSGDSGFYYNTVPNFGDGVLQALDATPRFEGVNGLGTQACEGGTYLQSSIEYGPPSGTDITVHAETVNEAPLTLCVLLEQDFTYNGQVIHRGGSWEPSVLEEGFTPSAPFKRWKAEWKSYCKTFDPQTDPTYFVVIPPPREFTFHLPTSDNLPRQGLDGGMIHGLCIMDATNFRATVSGDSGFYYNTVPNFGDGVLQALDATPRFEGVNGLGTQACEGGTYLQSSIEYGPPSGTDITVHAETVNEAPLTLCVLLEQDFTYNGQVIHRGGSWEPSVLEEGFTPSAPFKRWKAEWKSYCKTFDPKTDPTYFVVIPPPREFTFHLPTSDNLPRQELDGGMIHGLCIMDATNFRATVSGDSGFYYNTVPNFGDGVLQALDATPRFEGVNGLGTQACEGGTYLQSSIEYGPPSGTDITVHAETVNEAPLTLCVLLEQDFTYNGQVIHRGGSWEPSVLEEGFTPSAPFKRWKAEWKSYCKTFDPKTDPTYFGLESTFAPESLSLACPEDIKVKHTDGVTPFPGDLDAVSIVSQDTSTVTVDLKQSWASSVEKYFYSYRENVYSVKCYEEVGVAPGELIDTITIQCNLKSPTAQLQICLQDTTKSLLSSGDEATVPKCCHSDAPVGTATVCYQLEIRCQTTC